MNIYVCILLIVVASASALKGVREPSPPALLFLEGLGYGLEVEIGNVTECAKDLNVTLDDFDAGYTSIRKGIDNWNIFEIEKGLKDWAAGLEESSQVLKVCGAEELAADIEKLAQELQGGVSGLLELLAKEILVVVDKGVGKLFRDAVTYWEQENYYQAGVCTGQIVGLLLNQISRK
eukprot:TRINITY_DN719_c0_g1_i2.p1 TRINITY_DN719_c0_g1~~TRINITY_DN719_c0_g1_i2.p1  ORF type:complete len:191 (-),score=51.74 TRINITY_DN719_c0_g1_i2:45-575(-)